MNQILITNINPIYRGVDKDNKLNGYLKQLKNLEKRVKAFNNKLHNDQALRDEYQYYELKVKLTSYTMWFTTRAIRSTSKLNEGRIYLCKEENSDPEDFTLQFINNGGNNLVYKPEELSEEQKKKVNIIYKARHFWRGEY